MKINKNLQIVNEINSRPVKKTLENLKRDLYKTCSETKESGNRFVLKEKQMAKEKFELVVEGDALVLRAGDDLGFIYGIYYISKEFLGIPEFWFWNDYKVQEQNLYEIPDNYQYSSEPFAVKYRGWFVNDEVLIHTWSVDREQDQPWEMVFEALLRCGGNMTIPGTDKNAERYRKMAAESGLFITHHHAEPLGAPMFARVFPDLNPSYAEYPEKFWELWKQGMEQQKDYNVIWNLGFRGQGDCPFWNSDPKYETPQARGQLMSELIRIQYQLVKEQEQDALCCTNLYGETMELYQQGLLELPEDVIKIWADNGYGKMVTRRQENHNPRIKALPNENDNGLQGIYYHVSFYDLQAANHITMLPNNPEFIRKELLEVLEKKMNEFWLINCSNVKPHVYFLDLIAKLWKEGNHITIQEHRKNYVKTYYGEKNSVLVTQLLEDYSNYALQYGEHEDDHAGEQFANHVARILISQFMKAKETRSEELLWATSADTLEGQILWYLELCKKACVSYEEYIKKCIQAAGYMEGNGKILYKDSIELQVKIFYYCFSGAKDVCKSLLEALKKNYQKAFYMAGVARKSYLKANMAMRSREHGMWHDFYKNECLTDVKQTAWVLEGLMSYLRSLGDGPHFYQWQRDFLYPKSDRRVMLIMNMENHLKDQEIFELMKEKWQ